jgi:hypothetical protein
VTRRRQVAELHSHLESRLATDLQLPEAGQLTELQEACCLAQVDRVAVFAGPDSLEQAGPGPRGEPCR